MPGEIVQPPDVGALSAVQSLLPLPQSLHLSAQPRPAARPLVLPTGSPPAHATSSSAVARATRERLDAGVAIQVSQKFTRHPLYAIDIPCKSELLLFCSGRQCIFRHPRLPRFVSVPRRLATVGLALHRPVARHTAYMRPSPLRRACKDAVYAAAW